MSKPLSILKIGMLFILCMVLTSCVAASDWLSGAAPSQNSFLNPSNRFALIQIGDSTKQDVEANFGNPIDRQLHSIDGIPFESFSYSTAETEIRPYQYIPFFGALAFWSPLTSQTPSAAISFSPEDVVSGLTLSTVNAYGDIRSSEIAPTPDSSYSFYGMRNPDVSQTPADSTRSKS